MVIIPAARTLAAELAPLDITAPPDWNKYDAYVGGGGSLEYEQWHRNRSLPPGTVIQLTAEFTAFDDYGVPVELKPNDMFYVTEQRNEGWMDITTVRAMGGGCTSPGEVLGVNNLKDYRVVAVAQS